MHVRARLLPALNAHSAGMSLALGGLAQFPVTRAHRRSVTDMASTARRALSRPAPERTRALAPDTRC